MEEVKKKIPVKRTYRASLFEMVFRNKKELLGTEKMPLEGVVELAIEECIEEGILADFLSKNRAEAKSVSIYEYDEARHMRQTKEEGREEGRLSAIADAIRICADLGASRENTITQIIQKYGLPIEKAEEMVGKSWK